MNGSGMLGVIPARFQSSRFPGKPLVNIGGQSMVQRVYGCAVASGVFSEVVVATDDERIASHVSSWGGAVELTDRAHPSGTDRVAEVAVRRPQFPWVVNIQGDEPFLPAGCLAALAQILASGGSDSSTLVYPLRSREALHSPHVVKAVLNQRQQVMYFSRSVIPWIRSTGEQEKALAEGLFFGHIGIYGFRREALLRAASLPASPLESAESLEQLRWLQAGWSIAAAVVTDYTPAAIDTPEDWRRLTGRQAGEPEFFY